MDATMMDYQLTLVHVLERARTIHPNVEVVWRMPDRSLQRYTYGDMHRRSVALAEALQKAGLKEGERVGTLMWNHYAHMEAYFGIPLSGGVLHTLNLRLHPKDLSYIINHAGDRFVIVDDVLLPLWDKVKDLVDVEKVFVVSLTGQPLPGGTTEYEELLSTATGDYAYPDIKENQALGMCYTTGTTGRPKGVVYSHRAMVLHCLGSGLADTLAVSQQDIMVPVVPMFHANAWGIPFTATFFGSKVVHPGPHLDPESLLDLFEKEKVNVTAGVPTIWFGILQAIQKEPDRWNLQPGMRMIVGGAAAPESMIRAFDKHDLRVIHAWGMTETTPLGSVANLKPELLSASEDEQYAYRAKQGVPSPLVDVRAVGDEGEVAWDGESLGELHVRGPWVAGDYFNQPEARGQWTDDGWFRTGDVVAIDEHGYIRIADRTKDLVKSGGEWISSQALENALIGHDAVAEAAVIGVPHPKWQERPLAVVVLAAGSATESAAGSAALEEELKEMLAEKFASWWVPEAMVFAAEIPKTSTGKFQKSKLREQYQDWTWD